MNAPELEDSKAPALTTALLEEHKQMRALLEPLAGFLQAICRKQSTHDLYRARETVQQLVFLENIHTACEESALFPALTNYHPLPILEVEHEELLLKRAALLSGIFNYSFPEDCTDQLYQQGLAYLDLLKRHMDKEEHAIFPLAEQSLSPQEKLQTLAKMEAIRAAAIVIPVQEQTYSPKNFNQFQIALGNSVTKDIHIQSILTLPGCEVKILELKAGVALSKQWSSQQILLLLVTGEARWLGTGKELSLTEGSGIVMDPLLSYSVEAIRDCRFLMVLQGLYCKV